MTADGKNLRRQLFGHHCLPVAGNSEVSYKTQGYRVQSLEEVLNVGRLGW